MTSQTSYSNRSRGLSTTWRWLVRTRLIYLLIPLAILAYEGYVTWYAQAMLTAQGTMLDAAGRPQQLEELGVYYPQPQRQVWSFAVSSYEQAFLTLRAIIQGQFDYHSWRLWRNVEGWYPMGLEHEEPMVRLQVSLRGPDALTKVTLGKRTEVEPFTERERMHLAKNFAALEPVFQRIEEGLLQQYWRIYPDKAHLLSDRSQPEVDSYQRTISSLITLLLNRAQWEALEGRPKEAIGFIYQAVRIVDQVRNYPPMPLFIQNQQVQIFVALRSILAHQGQPELLAEAFPLLSQSPTGYPPPPEWPIPEDEARKRAHRPFFYYLRRTVDPDALILLLETYRLLLRDSETLRDQRSRYSRAQSLRFANEVTGELIDALRAVDEHGTVWYPEMEVRSWLLDDLLIMYSAPEPHHFLGFTEHAMQTYNRILAESELLQIVFAASQYRVDHGRYPDALDALVPDYIEPRLLRPYFTLSRTDDGAYLRIGPVSKEERESLGDHSPEHLRRMLVWTQPWYLPIDDGAR